VSPFSSHTCSFSTPLQIEGFKLHVTHMIKPFVSRVRYTPEVASRPERMEKDLANARKLAAILEDEAAKLSAAKVRPAGSGLGEKEGEIMDGEGDVRMEDEAETDGMKERGSEAVERRVEKVMEDMKGQGIVDVNDERACEERKVRSFGF